MGNASPQAGLIPAPKGSACFPCDIPAFCRSHYYRGKLLTERDFADEQQYHRDRMRLHTLALHGWGVVCGLKVRPHPHCPDRRLVVEEGLAIDRCGREIRVLKPAFIELPQSPAPAPKPPAEPAHEHLEQSGADHAAPPEACEPEPQPKELYLCITYTECETEFSPAPFDDCGCVTDSRLQPNRVCEGFRLELFECKPSFWNKAIERSCEANDCREIYGEGCERCHEPGECCVPLAVIIDFVPGRNVLQEQIRIRGHRRQLASTETLDNVLRCILDKLPIVNLTQIIDTNWEHGQSYLCRDFMSEFVGAPEDHQRGFRISFSQKVHPHKVDPRTFQAHVVFRNEDPTQPRHLEVVPIQEIQKEGEATDWCRLVINRHYAHQRLDGRDFELYLTLKCDFITDLRGSAVDGNFINGELPTGDAVQGGTFESWIHVRAKLRTERY
jgi:hypothetical protein